MKTVLITGATSGIGKATAELLAKSKFRLIICGRNEDVLNQMKTDLSASTEIFSLKFAIIRKLKTLSIPFQKTGKILTFSLITQEMHMEWIL